MKTATLYSWTIALLALFAGGCITILFIIVPFWFSLPPQNLMQWFTDFGPIVGITMVPMEIAPFLLSLIAYYRASKHDKANRMMWMAVNMSNILILISLVVYFLPVNFSFVQQTLPVSSVNEELKQWKLIHTGRTILSVLSMCFGIYIQTRNQVLTS